jgi:hypothetical protein
MKLFTKSLLAAVSASSAVAAHAHDGHGLFGSHWHATDALGFVAVAALVALAIWMSRK